jgi:putative membrane-bound dehydrogenase-like protein
MKLWSIPLVALPLVLALPAPSDAQVHPSKVEATFKVVDGLQMKLWASEPLFVNPTCMDIDHKGRVWVCESVNYRNKLRRFKKLTRPAGDRIVILEDTRGKGVADKATTFYQSPQTLAPLGIAVAKDPAGPGYKVFVCQSPDILVFTDSKGVGKADGPPKKLLSGFGGYDHDHGVHGILLGPDRKLYFSVGDTGVHGLQSSDKKGRVWRSNGTDCRAGTIWRCDLDGKNLELIAHNFRNEYEPCVDSFGTVFVSDNDDDGNRQTRICHVMPGGDYGYHPRIRGDTHWHEEQPGVVPKILRTYEGSPTGICVYEGSLLPRKYRGQLLHTDALPRHVRCYHLAPRGASYAVKREDMVTSSDNWFRPSDVCVAPDGAVFVADWCDPGVGGHGMGDIKHGRIYRLAPKGNRPRVPKVDLGTPRGILAALGSPALSVRYMALTKLKGMSLAEAKKVLAPALEDRDNPILRARAFWAYYGRTDLKVDAVRAACAKALAQTSDPRFGLLGLRVLKDRGVSPADLAGKKTGYFTKLAPSVRREALLLLRDVDPTSARGLIYELAKGYDGKDRFYLAAVGIAVGHHDAKRRAALLSDFAKQFPTWNDKVAGLVWELQPPGVAKLLEERLNDTNLSAEERTRAIDILATSRDRDAGRVLVKALTADCPAEVRERILDHLKRLLPEKWGHLKGNADFGKAVKALLGKPPTCVTGLELVGLAGRVDALPEVLALARSKAEKEPVRRAAVRALGLLPSAKAAAALRGLLDAEPASLRSAVVSALGEVTRQPGNGAHKAVARKALEGLVRDGKRSEPVRIAAVGALAGTLEGGLWLLALHARGQLPKGLQGESARLLRNSVYRDVRARATVAFPPPGRLNPKKLPSIATLAARKGDAARGKKLLAESVKSNLQCLKCHTVRGLGGQVGPDLSMIGKKASRENLFESILYPSKAIADQYVTWVIETKKGLSLSGLIVEEGKGHVVLRDAEGRDTRLAKKDIESRTKSPKSLMPDDQLVYLTEGDLIDLVEYLYTLKTPALTFDAWHIVGPFDNGSGMEGLDRAYPPEKKIDLKATYKGKHGKVSWRSVRTGGGGYIDLQAFFAGRSDNIVSYLTRELVSPSEQNATILLGTDDGAKLWVNGKLVFTSRATRAAVPEQDAVKVKLRKGVNRLVLKINNGNGPHGFYCTILSEQELKPVGKKK